MTAFTDAKQRFSSRVADYVRYRPGYPHALLEVLKKDCGLRHTDTIADVGSGTGFLSELFLKNGNRVYGIEPNVSMRIAGEEYLATYENFTSIAASAEATSLPDASVHFVVAGQAFHWFDATAAKSEFLRILKPHGYVVVAWNDRQMDSPFADAYENLLVQYGTDYKRVRQAYPEQASMEEFFGKGNVALKNLPNEQIFDWDGLLGRLRSSSYAPQEGDANYAPMLTALEKLFRENERDGRVRMQYATHVYFGQLQKRENA